MGKKIGIAVLIAGGAVGLIWLFGALSKSNAVAKASTPGVTVQTPINPTPASWFANIPVIGGVLKSLAASPSPVSPGIVTPASTSPEGGAVTTDNFIQGPSYSQFLSQQTDAGISAYGNLPLTPLPPSFVTPQTGIDTTMVMAAPAGIQPPGISMDNSDYSGTGDPYFANAG